jgi:hypothetical protein
VNENRFALIVASSEYEDPELRRLTAPDNDAAALASVLSDPALGGFQVKKLINETSLVVSQAIEEFFTLEERSPDDLLLLYFSGHGIKDDDGKLYFALRDTRMVRHRPVRATAVGAGFVSDMVRDTRSRRQVLLLDCCYSGAFAASLTKGDQQVGVADHFRQGRGLVLLTASDSIQYSFEEQAAESGGVRSVFTRHLIRGIETGEAARGEESVSIDDLYDYVLDRVTRDNPRQHPRRWNLNLEGKIYIARNPAPLKPAALPEELQESIDDRRPWVRRGAIEELARLLAEKRRGIAIAARESLLALRDRDDSLQVRDAAAQSLAAFERSNPNPPAAQTLPSAPATAPAQAAAAAAGAGSAPSAAQPQTRQAKPPRKPRPKPSSNAARDGEQSDKERLEYMHARAERLKRIRSELMQAPAPLAQKPPAAKPPAAAKPKTTPPAAAKPPQTQDDRRLQELIHAARENWQRTQSQSPRSPAEPVRQSSPAEVQPAGGQGARQRELLQAAYENWKRASGSAAPPPSTPPPVPSPPAKAQPAEAPAAPDEGTRRQRELLQAAYENWKRASQSTPPPRSTPPPAANPPAGQHAATPKKKPKPEPLLSAWEIASQKFKPKP